MSVQFTPDSVEALLKISPVQAEDEATYKCEITYLEVIDNCDVVQIVKLKTLKKPDKVRITDGSGNQLSNATVLGPKKERAEVELTCEAVGGKPVPQVKWFNRTTELRRAKYSVEGKDDKLTGKSVLKLSLSRGDILARFECRVESDALDEPIISWITTDVQVPPTKVNLIEERNHVVRGEEIKLICNVPGARPAATIRWKNDTHDVTDENIFKTSIEDNLDGTYTTVSYLSFNAAHYQDEDKIQCFAKNDIMVENNAPELYASTILDIKYPPVFNFTAHNITVNESSGNTYVTMNCHFMANPQNLKVIYWLKDGRNLTSTNKKYEGATMKEPSLTIHDIDRDDIGEYTCTVGNEVGLETSEGILLNVQYPPDVEVVMEPSTPVKAVDNSTVLLECNVTSGNPSTLEKVRWFMDGQLMKEFPQCNYSSYDENGVGEGYGGPFCGLDPSILSLEGVVETFAGNYTCQGKNLAGWGTESEPKELIVYYPPSAATLRYSPSDVIKEKSVTLECIVKDPGRPDNLTYKWYRGLHQLADITTSNFTIPTVRLETRSNFTCFAENEGGKGNPATVFINVNAPPLFIQKLPTYQGVLYSSKNINLTCIIECYPECSIIWKKDDVVLDIESNSLYTVETTNIPAHPGTNDFESINSTLIWNIDRWPGKKLDKSAPHSRYTCESSNNSVGPGVSSTIEIAVDYPPENVEVVPKVVSVIEHQAPSTVKCHGEGHPALRYKWSKNSTSEIISTKEELVLGPMKRTDTGKYRCEAENKHGTEFAWAHFIVQYAPECSISIADKDSRPALLCTVHANPANVTFTWRVRESNETILVTSNIVYEDLKSYLYLDSSVDTARTYYCSANNSVGSSMPCERDVAGNLPWWKQLNQDKMIIIIASIIAIIIIVIIICVIIIILCRRKRADTKYNSPLEMEEREKFLCTQSPDVLGLPLVPCGRVTYLGNQVVTFKKVNPSTPVMKPEVVSSRKRKKPGEAPNPSSIEDKARLGAAPPVGGIADPLTDPDKGFYENLPFHGMQNPPNKPYRPDPCDLEYADVDYKSYGPINYKAASMYAAMKRNKNNNKMEEVNKEDLL